MKTIRILIADDHELVRRGLRGLLEAHPGWNVCAEARDGRAAVEKALELKPDIVILDISMPEMNGLDAARRLHKDLPQTEVLILTMHESEQIVREVLSAGARGYVLKSDAGRDLVAAVESLLRHKPFFTRHVAQLVLAGYLSANNAKQKTKNAEVLSGREREIVQLLVEGKTNKEVAGRLGISVKTVESHRGNINKKLDIHSFGDLVRYAIRNKIVEG